MCAALVVVVLAGLYWVDLGPTWQAFESRGIRGSRIDLWRDALRMFPHFPLLGSGLDTFGSAYPNYQTLSRYHWYGEAHDEYLQVLLDTGIVGALLMAVLLWTLLRAALRAARESPLDGGMLGALLACCFHNLVDFNWQIPANAATFAAIAGLSVRRGVEARLHAVAVDSDRGAA